MVLESELFENELLYQFSRDNMNLLSIVQVATPIG
jgi:hypothetical protein